MQEFSNSPFTFSELRTIVDIAHSPERLKGLAKEIKFIRFTLKNNPKMVWEQYSVLRNPELQIVKADNILQSTFDRFHSGYISTLYWRDKYGESPTITLNNIRNELDVPEDVNIQEVKFLEDCLVLIMDDKNRNAYYNHILKKSGEKRGEGLKSVGGFYSNRLFLTDENGNKCSVIVSNSNEEIIRHEREHVIFGNYYKRNKYQKNEIFEDVQIRSYNQLKDKLKANSTDFQTVLSSAQSILKPILEASKGQFYDEIVAESATFGDVDEKEKMRKMRQLLDYMPDNFQHTQTSALWVQHSYGSYIGQVVDGLRDVINETNLSSHDKLKISYQLEYEATQVASESRILAKWLSELWEKVGGDSEEFVSILEAVPFKYRSSLGYFIDKDPAIIEKKMKNNELELQKREDLAFWRMLLKHSNDNQLIKVLPNLQTHTEIIKQELKKRIVFKDGFDLTNLTTFLQKEVVSFYGSLQKQLLEKLYPEYIRFFNECLQVNIPTVRHKWLMERFIRTYEIELLNFQAIKEAIIELFMENNLLKQLDKAMIIYEKLQNGDEQTHNGFGYKIIESEDKIHEELKKKFNFPI